MIKVMHPNIKSNTLLYKYLTGLVNFVFESLTIEAFVSSIFMYHVTEFPYHAAPSLCPLHLKLLARDITRKKNEEICDNSVLHLILLFHICSKTWQGQVSLWCQKNNICQTNTYHGKKLKLKMEVAQTVT